MTDALLYLGGVILSTMTVGAISGLCISMVHFFLKGRRGSAYARERNGQA